MRVVVTGAAGAVGKSVVALFQSSASRSRHSSASRSWHSSDPGADSSSDPGAASASDPGAVADEAVDVVAVDKASLDPLPASVAAEQVDLADGDLAALFSGADAVVHLAAIARAGSSDVAAAERELALFHRLLDALSAAGVSHLVVLSSAMVYGARKGNPVPLTEDAPVRPNPDFNWAVQRCRLEQLAWQWRVEERVGSPEGPARAVTLLRPAAVVADRRLGHLARTLRAARAGVAADGDPPVQYLHADDLAAAVVAVVRARFDGAVNVAPDGWIPPDALADLEGPRSRRLRVRPQVARAVSELPWQWGLAETPPGVVPYTVHSWVVANDRLRALGWSPAHTNEEAFVVSHKPAPWESLPARRRQELLLGGAAAAALGAAGLVAWAASRLRRR